MRYALNLTNPVTGFGNIIHSYSSKLKDGTQCFMLVVENRNSFLTRFSSLGFWPCYTYAQSVAAWGGGILLANNGLNSLETWTNNNSVLSSYSPTQIAQLGMSNFNFSTMGHFTPGNLNFLGGTIDDVVPQNFKLVITNNGMNLIKELITFNSPTKSPESTKQVWVLYILFAVAIFLLLTFLILISFKSLRNNKSVLIPPPQLNLSDNKLKAWDSLNKSLKDAKKLTKISEELAENAANHFNPNVSTSGDLKVIKALQEAAAKSQLTEKALENVIIEESTKVAQNSSSNFSDPLLPIFSSTQQAPQNLVETQSAIEQMKGLGSNLTKTLKEIRESSSGAPFVFFKGAAENSLENAEKIVSNTAINGSQSAEAGLTSIVTEAEKAISNIANVATTTTEVALSAVAKEAEKAVLEAANVAASTTQSGILAVTSAAEKAILLSSKTSEKAIEAVQEAAKEAIKESLSATENIKDISTNSPFLTPIIPPILRMGKT